MNATTFKSWLGQVTTGIGALIAAPVVIALLSSQITLGQAIPKGKNMDLIVEKATELGAAAIVPLLAYALFGPERFDAYRLAERGDEAPYRVFLPFQRRHQFLK